ncbi:MAG: cupredoxin domain-containing protein [Xenococcaceae cyanobacterium MO_207.B15]|nr:cupredoxin domain-containing protein [Xenococcaceae cyanobacterium MO_207.B15]MDJ0743693.1 cupredoxin domain-containing protein [Xenococcaceae cyanobacterium MO_167.B27]
MKILDFVRVRKIVQQVAAYCIAIMVFSLLWLPTASANPELTAVKVSLGNSAGELKFFPSNLEFETGKEYQLLLDNPSPTKHYFTAKDFADASWTKKVQAGKVEVKGAIHELELKPGAVAEWVLTPMKSGKYELHCSIKGHKEAGMIGEIVVK